jgi:ubiquinone/menaquinone biosynthesis C-methylase UbiE
MSPPRYLKPEFSPDAFAGTAVYYSRYRIPYPQILFEDLIKRTTPPPQAKLLDLASGPGRIAIQLAPLFSKVWANDIDSEMVAVGKIEAKKRKVNNIEWFIGKAEELNMESNSFDLITIGEAFHRLDQNLITNLTLRWLKPGGHIAIMGCYSILSGKELWQDIINEIVSKWTSHHSSSCEKFTIQSTNRGPEHCRLVLQDKGFDECNSYSYVFPHYWTIESIRGNLYSTSRCSKKVLGDNIVEFESELKAALNKIDKRGRFFENIRCGYTQGKKPLF